MTVRRKSLNFGRDAIGLDIQFTLWKGKNNEVSYIDSAPSVTEYGAGVYVFSVDDEDIEDDIIFMSEDTSREYRILGEIEKEKYKRKVISDIERNQNGQIVSAVQSVQEVDVEGIYFETERINIENEYVGSSLSRIIETRVS